MSDELKPCSCGGQMAWCGDLPMTFHDHEFLERHDCHQLVCTSCKLRVDYDSDDLNKCDSFDELRQLVAGKWNTRATQQVDRELVKGLKQLRMLCNSQIDGEEKYKADRLLSEAIAALQQQVDGDDCEKARQLASNLEAVWIRYCSEEADSDTMDPHPSGMGSQFHSDLNDGWDLFEAICLLRRLAALQQQPGQVQISRECAREALMHVRNSPILLDKRTQAHNNADEELQKAIDRAKGEG